MCPGMTRRRQQPLGEMSNTSLEQWLRRLQGLHPKEMELGLERVRAVAQTLDLLPLQVPVITVAGTNGKGSTVAVLEALLLEVGCKPGTFTSPHFLRFNERIRVGGHEAPDNAIVEAFTAIDQARGDISLTYFEFAALAALLVFRESGANVVVLEVGLGGRLDAVNIVDPSVAVITSIDLDHQDWLGQSRGEIAREKAGILRAGVPVVIAEPDPPDELNNCVGEVGAKPALYIGRDFQVAANGSRWSADLLCNGSIRCLQEQNAGALLPQNMAAAAQAVLLLGIEFSDGQLSRALGSAAPRGRRETHDLAGTGCVLDVAHNPAAIDKLLEYLKATRCNGKEMAIFSVMSDKDARGMIEAAVGYFDAWFLGDQPHNERAASAAEIADLLRLAGQNTISVSKNLRQAWARARSIAAPGDRIVVFGSFFTVAEVLPLLDRDMKKHGAA